MPLIEDKGYHQSISHEEDTLMEQNDIEECSKSDNVGSVTDFKDCLINATKSKFVRKKYIDWKRN